MPDLDRLIGHHLAQLARFLNKKIGESELIQGLNFDEAWELSELTEVIYPELSDNFTLRALEMAECFEEAYKIYEDKKDGSEIGKAAFKKALNLATNFKEVNLLWENDVNGNEIIILKKFGELENTDE